VLVVGSSLVLFALRGPGLSGNTAPVSFSGSSREGYLLANNVLMVTAAGSVLLGTMYPLVLDTLGLGKISVGPPYFEAVFFPVMAPAAFLMGVGPIARWRSAPVPELAARLKWAFAVAIAATIIFVTLSGRFGKEGASVLGAIAFAIGIFLGLWLLAASVVAVWERASQIKAPSWGARLRSLPGGFWGMIVAHAGVGLFCIGVASVLTLEIEVDTELAPGQTMKIREYELKMLAMQEIAGPNYRAIQGRIQVSRDGRPLFELKPEKRFYTTTQMVMTEADIDSGVTRDLYVSLGEQLPSGSWTVKAWVKPFIDWIWVGCFMMAIGGFVAISDRRYRRARAAAPAAASAGAVA
jgi:cytochrome c-type biogenesis protein CcmF